MQQLSRILKAEIEEFRALGRQFLNKEITVAQFKGRSGGMGVYAQRGGEAFMIRLRTPSGVASREHLALIAGYARQYGLDRVHLTTRQAVQLHDLDIDAVCDIMDDAIDHQLFTRGGGGNFPRNVALAPLSGVERGEAFDPTPHALLTGQYLLKQITGYKLPRKLKIAFSNSGKDDGCATCNDLGFLADVEDGRPCYRLFLAGGLGANPAAGIPYGRPVAPEDVLYHVEAMTRLFMAEGDYENKGKARIRYIPRRMGTEAFLACYEEHLARVKAEKELIGLPAALTPETAGEPELPVSDRLIPQKQAGLYTVVLHPLGGQLLLEDLERLLTFLEDCGEADVRLSMNEELYVRHLTAEQAAALLEITAPMQKTPVEMSVSCIGVPTCQIGVEQSQALLRHILEALKQAQAPLDRLPRLHISGCANSCARHQIAPLGLAGRRKKVGDAPADVFDLYTGGSLGRDGARLGELKGSLRVQDVPAFLVELAGELERADMDFSAFLRDKPEAFDALLAPYKV